jgi:pimeloyl-ACP methyl ester carboxylesterase
MPLHHEVTGGAGPPVVFLHPGLADSRLWDPQWTSFADRYRLVRCDLPGFGETPIDGTTVAFAADVAELLDELAVTRAALVGCSLGGRVALELAVARPELVRALVLVGAGLPGLAWSESVQAHGKAQHEAVERGDLAAATELSLRMWVDGPGRSPADVDAAMRAAVGRMQRRALERQAPVWDRVGEEPLVPDLAARLGELAVPTLVLVGEGDIEDIHERADLLAGSIRGAERATIADAAHVPSFERPAAFDAIVLEFLARNA